MRKERERKERTMTLQKSHLKTSARGSWDAICSDLFVDRGQMMIGKVGGAKARRIMCPYLLTNHGRESITMKEGTTFHFVTEGIESALEKARKAANGKDIRIGGGVSTIRQFLEAGYIDEMHLAISPIFLGSGEHLFVGPDGHRVDLPRLGFTETQTMYGKGAAHVILKKSK
jgi:hypothetical protein